MKKVLLSGAAMIFAVASIAQSMEAGKGIKDDFTTVEPVASSSGSFGAYWFNDEENPTKIILTRTTDGMTIACDSTGDADFNDDGVTDDNDGDSDVDDQDGVFDLFGLGFGDSNGDLAGGDPHYLDLSGDADMSITIENTSTSTDAFITIQLEDINGTKAEFEPDVSDVTTDWGSTPRKGKIGFILDPSSTRTIDIDLNNGGTNRGGLTAGAYTCSGPSTCPVTSYDIDITRISKILFFVNGGARVNTTVIADPDGEVDVSPAEAIQPFKGNLIMTNFEIGTGQITLPIVAPEDEVSTKVSPNPASGSAVVSYDVAAGSAVTVFVQDLTGATVATASGSESSTTVDLSGVASGLYTATVVADGVPVSVSKLVVE